MKCNNMAGVCIGRGDGRAVLSLTHLEARVYVLTEQQQADSATKHGLLSALNSMIVHALPYYPVLPS
jgi:hypothetical protein